MPRFYVENFGCRATQADGAALEQQLRSSGLQSAAESGSADLIVLNTCTVTSSADQDARAAIRRIHRHNPAARIVVTGCYAQRDPDSLAALPGVEWVIGNSDKHRLAEIVLRSDPATRGDFVALSDLLRQSHGPSVNRVVVSDIFAHTELLAAPVFDAAKDRTRPNLKVQDGCNNRCSFCVIPQVRGQSRSLPLDRVVREAETLVAAGYRELVISGINLGRWGRDRASRPGAPSLPGLIRAILDRTALEKLRISSVEPMDWSDELISLVATSPRIAKHAHVPMQSGSDSVLRRMHRKYRPWHYREKIRKISDAMPTAAIGADVMVGFPGETQAEFDATARMVEELPFTYLHVFTYSSRPGTIAERMPDHVPGHIARERNRILRDLADSKKRAFLHSFVGMAVDAITLRTSKGNFTEALTDNYLKLQIEGTHPSNHRLAAQVFGVKKDYLIGRI